MLPFFLLHSPVYVDDGILSCIERGDSACILSYRYVNDIPRLMEQQMEDSARALLERAYEIIKDKNLPLWKAYLRALYGQLLYRIILDFDVQLLKNRKDFLIRLAREIREAGKDTPIEPYTHIASGNLMKNTYPSVPTESFLPLDKALASKNIRSRHPLPIAFRGFHTVVDTAFFPVVMTYIPVRPLDSTYERALKSLSRHPDPYIRSDIHMSLALYYMKKGLPLTSLYHATMIMDSLGQIDDPFMKFHYYTFVGDITSYFYSDHRVGYVYYKKALSIADSMKRIRKRWGLTYPIILNNVGLSEENDSIALEILRRSLKLHLEIFGTDNEGVANVMANIYNRMLRLGMMDSALALHRQIVRIRKKTRGGKFDWIVFDDMIGRARYYLRVGDTARAKLVARASLDSLQTVDAYYPNLPGWYIIGKVIAYEILEDHDSALYWLNMAQKQFTYATFILMHKLKLYALRGEYERASSIMDTIEIRLLMGSSMTSISRKNYYQKLQRRWEKLLPLLISRGLKSGPVRISELLKAKLLSEEINWSSDPVMDSLTRKLYAMIDMGLPYDSLLLMEKRIFAHMVERRRSFAKKAGILPEGTALLGYVVGREKLTEYLITRKDTITLSIDIPADSLEGLVNHLLSSPSTSRKISMLLWRILIEPFDTFLAGYRALAISPHGILTQLPFAILYDGKEFLVEKPYSIYRVFSLWNFGKPCRVKGPALAVGRNSYEKNEILTRRKIGNLRYAEEEARAVALSIGGIALTGSEVSEEKIYEMDPSRFPVIHFATHAIVDSSSMIVLGPSKDTLPSRDNILRLGEIYSRLRVKNLVVLSGCRTGLGKFINDWEGLFNLTRGFVYTGARCVISTLWDLNDFASYLLMKRMYGYLARGETVDRALKKAQLYILRNTGLSSPVYWGGFVLTVAGR